MDNGSCCLVSWNQLGQDIDGMWDEELGSSVSLSNDGNTIAIRGRRGLWGCLY